MDGHLSHIRKILSLLTRLILEFVLDILFIYCIEINMFKLSKAIDVINSAKHFPYFIVGTELIENEETSATRFF